MKNSILILVLVALIGAGLVGCGPIWPIVRPSVESAGKGLAACLVECGAASAVSAVTTWSTGVAVDGAAIGWAALPCVIKCCAAAGGFVWSAWQSASDSVGATMAPSVRPLLSDGPWTERACGSGREPDCVIVLPSGVAP